MTKETILSVTPAFLEKRKSYDDFSETVGVSKPSFYPLAQEQQKDDVLKKRQERWHRAAVTLL